MSVGLVIVAAGSGTRLGASVRKGLVVLEGLTLVERSAKAFQGIGRITDRVVVVHPDDLAEVASAEIGASLRRFGVTAIVAGGASRIASALAGVRAVSASCDFVVVHDAARPFVSKKRVEALLDVIESGQPALLAIPSVSTVKQSDLSGRVARTLDRSSIHLATTPQGGRRDVLLKLLEAALSKGELATDEATLLENAGLAPILVEDDVTNIKITHPSDLAMARRLLPPEPPRVGHGYDIHRLVENRPLVLCGVLIPSPLGLLGHSDADAALHAICDAMLGAAGLPDIGEHFPDTDPRFRGVASTELLAAVVATLADRGLVVASVDVSILAERPKLLPFKASMRESLMKHLGLPSDRVAVKARTGEGLDAIGRGEAIACHAVVVVTRSEKLE